MTKEKHAKTKEALRKLFDNKSVIKGSEKNTFDDLIGLINGLAAEGDAWGLYAQGYLALPSKGVALDYTTYEAQLLDLRSAFYDTQFVQQGSFDDEVFRSMVDKGPGDDKTAYESYLLAKHYEENNNPQLAELYYNRAFVRFNALNGKSHDYSAILGDIAWHKLENYLSSHTQDPQYNELESLKPFFEGLNSGSKSQDMEVGLLIVEAQQNFIENKSQQALEKVTKALELVPGHNQALLTKASFLTDKEGIESSNEVMKIAYKVMEQSPENWEKAHYLFNVAHKQNMRQVAANFTELFADAFCEQIRQSQSYYDSYVGVGTANEDILKSQKYEQQVDNINQVAFFIKNYLEKDLAYRKLCAAGKTTEIAARIMERNQDKLLKMIGGKLPDKYKSELQRMVSESIQVLMTNEIKSKRYNLLDQNPNFVQEAQRFSSSMSDLELRMNKEKVLAAIKSAEPVELKKAQTKGEGLRDYVKEEYKQDQIRKLEIDFAAKLKIFNRERESLSKAHERYLEEFAILTQKIDKLDAELTQVKQDRAREMPIAFRENVQAQSAKLEVLKQQLISLRKNDRTTEQLDAFPEVKLMEKSLQEGLSLDAIKANLVKTTAELKARRDGLSAVTDAFKVNGKKFSAFYTDIKAVEKEMSKLPKPVVHHAKRAQLMDEVRENKALKTADVHAQYKEPRDQVMDKIKQGVKLQKVEDKSHHKDAPNLDLNLYLSGKAQRIKDENPNIHKSPEFDQLMHELVGDSKRALSTQEFANKINQITPQQFNELVIATAEAIKANVEAKELSEQAKQLEKSAVRLVGDLGKIAQSTVKDFAMLAKYETKARPMVKADYAQVEQMKHAIASKLINAIEDAGFKDVKNIDKSKLEGKVEEVCKDALKKKSERSTFVKLKDVALSIFGSKSKESIAIEKAAEAKLANYLMRESAEITKPRITHQDRQKGRSNLENVRQQ